MSRSPWRRPTPEQSAPSLAAEVDRLRALVQDRNRELAAAKQSLAAERRSNAELRDRVAAGAALVAGAERECAAGCVHERLFKNSQRHAAELERRLSEVTARSFASDVGPRGVAYRAEVPQPRRETR